MKGHRIMKGHQSCFITIILLLQTCFLLVRINQCSATLWNGPKEEEEVVMACNLWMGISSIPNAGRGIFAGRDYQSGDSIEVTTIIPVELESIRETVLMNYIYGSDQENISLVMLGSGSLFNHHLARRNADHVWHENTITDLTDPKLVQLPFVNFTDTEFTAIANIIAGEEFFDSYGEDWFATSTRGGAEVFDASKSDGSDVDHSLSITQSQFSERICVSHVFVDESYTADQGKGLFAARDFSVGERITVSPVAILPKQIVDDTAEHSLLKNYCLSIDRLPIVLLPLGLPAVINHPILPEDVNVGIRWFDWNELSTEFTHPLAIALNHSQIFQLSLQEILSFPYIPLDIEYYALRDIDAGEELLMDYGSQWFSAWIDYIRSCGTTDSSLETCPANAKNRVFREYIRIPDTLFIPDQWFTL